MLNNPPRNLHTDYVIDDVLKTTDVNTLVQSVPFDFVITKERVDEYREKHGYTQADWMDVGNLLWEDYEVSPDYSCGGRSAIHILINFHTTIEDRFNFGGWLTSLTVRNVHIHSLSSFRTTGTTLNIYYHTHGTENYVLFDEDGGSLYRGSPLYVGSFALQGGSSGYPEWHSSAPFYYERCLDGNIPKGGGDGAEPNVIVEQRLWLSNVASGGNSGGGGKHIRVVDTKLTGIYCVNGVEGGDVETQDMGSIGGSGDLTRDVIVLDGVSEPKSVSDLFSDATYGADDPWFDGVYPNTATYPKIPRALDVGDADIIDVYTWSTMTDYNGVRVPHSKLFLNPHGQSISYTTGVNPNKVTHIVSEKPFHILADSLVENKIYELRVHLMHYSGYPSASTPKPYLNPVFKVHELDQDISLRLDVYRFDDVDSGIKATEEPDDFLVSFVPAQADSSSSTNKLNIARWLYTSSDPKSTGQTVLTLGYNYGLLNNTSQPNHPFPEAGIAKALFFKHNDYIYTLTY